MKKKKITLLAIVLATAALFTGCTIRDEYVPVDTEIQKYRVSCCKNINVY